MHEKYKETACLKPLTDVQVFAIKNILLLYLHDLFLYLIITCISFERMEKIVVQ